MEKTFTVQIYGKSYRLKRLLKSVGDCTLLTLPLGWLVRWQAKANVCNVRWHRIFLRGGFFLIFFVRLPFKAVSVVVPSCPKKGCSKSVSLMSARLQINLHITAVCEKNIFSVFTNVK